MGLRVCLSILLLCLTVLSAAFADTVTLTVVQNEKAPAIALEMSDTIEDEIFSCFFDAGHIASNTDVRFDGSRFSEKNFGVKEAAFGLSDFLVVISLQYGPAEVTDKERKITYAELDTLTWRLVEVTSVKTVMQKTIDVKKIRVTDFDPYAQVRQVADIAANDSLNAISEFKEGGKDK